jgi:hypothetical protein
LGINAIFSLVGKSSQLLLQEDSVAPKRKSAFLFILFVSTVIAIPAAAQLESPLAFSGIFQGASGQSKSQRYSLLSMQLSPSALSIKTGAVSQVTATGNGTDNQTHDVTKHITWTSSASAVATVSLGQITALAPGTATITASRDGVSSTVTVTVTNQGTTGVPVPSTLFSLTTHSRTDWPTVTISALRLWGTGTYWGDINTADGVYDFTTLDKWTSTAQTNNADLVYTFGETPTWASSNPGLVCGYANVPLGSCAPPDDLNADGTGTDQHWKDFVTAVVTHAAGQIKYWEIWNEPTVPGYWQGNNAQLLRMAQDAYAIIKSIDPTAQVTTPSPSTGINGVANWMGPYLALGGGKYAGIVSFHGYSWQSTPGDWPVPEDIVPLVDNLKAVLVTYGQDKKPLWCTEGSWGDTSGNGFTDPDLHAAFVARHYLLQESEGVIRYYWFAWDNEDDGLWDYSTTLITEAGTAYQQVENWVVNRTPVGSCVQSGTVWTCGYSGSGNFQGEAIWDTSQTCSNGSCTTAKVSVGSQYVQYLDVAGQAHSIVNKTVPVGAKPIWLQNQ